MSLVSKIMKLEPSLTSDDFNPETGTILVLSNAGVEIIEKWEHPSVKQPSNSKINTISDDTIIAEEKLLNLRAERNSRIEETDWWAFSDLTMTDAQKKYRQDLRDITKTYSSMDDEGFAWPTKP